MRKLNLIILLLSLNFSFAQTEKDDYEIYSYVINNKIENWFTQPIESIIIIEQYKHKYKQDFSLINVLTFDTIPEREMNWLTRDSTLQRRFTNDKKLKKVISKLTSDFENHPIINPKLINLDNDEIQVISKRKYSSLFGKRSKSVRKGWKKIYLKYGTSIVFQLSKIKYNGKYACYYLSFHCGGLCGRGNLIIMEKNNGEWKILTEFNLWES